MNETLTQSNEAGFWDNVPFRLPPLPLRGRLRKALAELICFVGATITKALPPTRQPIVLGKILVIRRGGLGDVLMATPLLRGLRAHFPDAKIYFLASKQAVVGLNSCPWVDQICEVPSSSKEWLQLLRRLRKEKIDAAFILHRIFAPSLVACAAGIPQRFGFDWKNHGFALTGSIPFSASRSQTMQIGQLLTLVGKPFADPTMDFAVDERDSRDARDLLTRWGLDATKPLVAIHPGGGETPLASEPAKRWSPERFARLADLLIERESAQVMLLQGPGDEPVIEKVIGDMAARPLGTVAGLPLRVFAALIRESDLLIVNDTGPMHLAAALGVPVVSIIGPTHPAYTPPRGSLHRVIWAGASCSPCYHPEEYAFRSRQDGKKLFTCWRSTNECMTAITAEEVHKVVIEQLRTAISAKSKQA